MGSRLIDYVGLGYLGVAAPDPVAWRDFATEVCGLVPAAGPPVGRGGGAGAPDGSVYLKLDDHQWRLAVHPADGAPPGLRYVGFEVASPAGLGSAVATLRARGAEVREGTPAEREARGVAALAVLGDPAGHRIELFAGPVRDGGFRSPTGTEFVTGDLGMGHVVLYVPDAEAALGFYRDVLGFARSDYMRFGPGGQGIHFLRCTRRHHSLALLAVGAPSGLQHLMLETSSLDAVGRCLDRALAREVPITSSLGRHVNDRMVSFYMRGPSGFDLEIGWDGRVLGDDWVEHEFTGGDEWGHRGLDAEALKPGGSP